jgi:opacity protein-like surface antigen
MYRLVLLATLLLLTTTSVLAQDDYKKYEFFGGYSAMHVDNLAGDTGNSAIDDILGDKQTLRGFNLEFGRNFHKYFGAKFDYSFHTREDNFNRPAGKRQCRLHDPEHPGRHSDQEQHGGWTKVQALWSCIVWRGRREGGH